MMQDNSKQAPISRHILPVMQWCWLTLLTCFTAFKYSPVIDADVLLNSLMSTRNITLFYWGQNRLLNVLPVLAAPFQDPALNLHAVLFLSSLFTFLLILVLSRFAAKVGGQGQRTNNASLIFLTLSSLFILCLEGPAISIIAIGHIEYSLPFLLGATAIYLAWFKKSSPILRYSAVIAFIFIATGLNPSIFLVIYFILLASWIYQKRFEKQNWFIGAIALASFASWAGISRIYGNIPYGKYDFDHLLEGINIVGGFLLKLVDLPITLTILGAWACWKATQTTSNVATGNLKVKLQIFCTYAFVVFSIGWLIFFSGNHWVVANDFNVRYFVFIIFGALLIAGIEINLILSHAQKKLCFVMVAILMLLAAVSVYSKPSPLENFKIFAESNSIAPPSYDFYAGDYWAVWPAVYRNQLLGKAGYGFANRGESNSIAATQYANAQFENAGHIYALCLKRTPQSCALDAQKIIGSVKLKTYKRINDDAIEIQLSR